MTLVLDASAVVDLLVRNDIGLRLRTFLNVHRTEPLFTVTHLDAEVFSGLARNHRAQLLTAAEVTELLRRLSELAVTRLPISVELLQAAWSLRDHIAARDALYVAAAQGLNGRLVTTDECLARAVPGLVAGPR